MPATATSPAPFVQWPTVPADPDRTTSQVRVMVAMPTAADVWDTARWDAAAWDASRIGNVNDLTCDVEGLQVTWGRDSTTGHVRPAELVVALSNTSGTYTPWADGPNRRRLWWLGAPVKVTTGTGPIFTGYVEGLSETDDNDDFPVVALRCSGVSGYLGSMDGVEQAERGAGETAGPRLDRICANALLPQWVGRRFDPGTVPLQGTTLARGALEECWLVADSDGGAFMDTPDGDVVFYDTRTMTGDRRYTEPQATFSDAPEAGAGVVVPTVNMTVELDADPVVDTVGIGCTGGTLQTADRHDSPWRARKTWSRTDLIHQGDEHSKKLANLILDRLANRVLKVSPLEFDALDSPAGWHAAHHLHPYDRVRITRRRHGKVLDLTATVDQVTHRITPDAWTCTVTVSPGAQRFDFARWDEARFDSARWA